MAGNATSTIHTKPVDIRQWCVNEYMEDGIVKIVFVKSAENDIDILTKTLSGDLHEKHSKKMICKRPEVLSGI